MGSRTAASAEVAHHASSNPSTAPRNDMTTASVTSWRMRRPRLAPSARRMPISFCRPDARASSMLATFAQAISSTRPTTVISPIAICTIIESASGCRCTSRVGLSVTCRPLLVAGNSDERRAISRSRFARASAIVLPRFRRPRTNIQRSARRSSRLLPVGDGIVSCMPTGSVSSDALTGTHSSGASTGTMPVKIAGATPTIVNPLPRMRIVRPTTSEVDPRSRLQ